MKFIFLCIALLLVPPKKGIKVKPESLMLGVSKIETFQKLYKDKDPKFFSNSLFFDGELKNEAFYDELGRLRQLKGENSNIISIYGMDDRLLARKSVYETLEINASYFELNDTMHLIKEYRITNGDTSSFSQQIKRYRSDGELLQQININGDFDTTSIANSFFDEHGNLIKHVVNKKDKLSTSLHYYSGIQLDSSQTDYFGREPLYTSSRYEYFDDYMVCRTFDTENNLTWEFKKWEFFDKRGNLIKSVFADKNGYDVIVKRITYRE